MDVEIINEKENELLGRKEIEFKIKNSVTVPSRKELMQKIAALKGTKEEFVVVQKIDHRFGNQMATGNVRVYSDKEMLEKVEEKHIVERHSEKKEKEEKKKEAPKKEKKEEAEKGKGEKAAEGKEEKGEKKKEAPKEEKEEGKAEEKKEEAKEEKPKEEGEKKE